ncbi:LuxR C-terminal-related transcriptional regulator [Paraburkholderia azotifigens]|uniref:LuxR C-terminal-related transcriptional regulator n=1 Tax=Paraburkholderia azotifigens TaxID=2057004 RepID=UPI00316F31C3
MTGFPAEGGVLKSAIDTKLLPPPAGRGLVPRDALLTRLTEARRLRCFVIQGPAGYGKTTTLAGWCRALIPLGYDTAWLSLAPEDDHVAAWLGYVTKSIATIAPGLTREAEELGEAGADEDAVERQVVALVRGIARHRREIILVLDDLHNLKDPAVHGALQWLIEYAPDNLHIALASRLPPPVSLERLRAESAIVECGPTDLRFSLQESKQFLASQLGSIDDTGARRLHALTDGWAAGLQLFSAAWKRRRRGAPKPGAASAFFHKQLRDSRAFARYFDEEVLCRLAPDELDLLIRVSACDRFCASLCAALIDHSETQATMNATVGELLARFESDNLFVSTVNRDERESWYGLHPLLRDSLTERLAAWDEAARHNVHAAASRWFEARGHLDEAIRHALKAGEATRAAVMLENCAQLLFVQGDRAMLMRLLRELPAKEVESSIELRIWTARVQIYRREFDASARTLDALDAELPGNDVRHRFVIAAVRALLGVQRDDATAVQAVEPQLAAPPADADKLITAGCRHVLTWLYMRRGEYQRARDVQLDAAITTVDGTRLVGSIVGSLYGQCLAGLSHALEGNMGRAEQVYRSVLRAADLGGKACYETANFATALLSEVLVERLEDRTALAILENRVDTLEQASLPDCFLRAMLSLASAHAGMGNPLEAEAHLERLEEYALHLGLDRLLAHSLAAQVAQHVARGALDAASLCLDRLDVLDARHPHEASSAYSEIRIAARSARVRWQLATDDTERALHAIAPLLAYCAAHGRQREQVGLLMQRAAVLMRQGRASACFADVADALRRAHRLGLARTLLEATPESLALVGQVSHNGALDPVLAFYTERLQSRAALASARTQPAGDQRPDASEPPRAIPTLSQRETDVVRLLAEAFTAKKIARTLGLSPETVKWHLTNIYSKLGVSGRDEALDRIRDIHWGSGPGIVRPPSGD